MVDVRSGAQIADHVPFKIDSFSDQLGVAVGNMTGSLPVGAGPIDVDEALMPSDIPCRVIVPCYEGQPYGAYLVTQKGAFGPKSTEVTFTAERVDYVLRRRELWSTLQFIQQDQLDIARALVGYGIGLSVLPGLDSPFAAMLAPLPTAARMPWWTLDASTSGRLRDRLDNDAGYQMQKHPKIADLLRALTEDVDEDVNGVPGPRAALGLPGSFDYRLDYTRSPTTGALGVTVRLGYPRLGSADPLPLEYPGNIADWRVATDTADSETMTRIFGAGTGVERKMGPIATDHTAHDNGWPLLMGSGESGASDANTLAEQSNARLGKFKGANYGWTVAIGQELLPVCPIGSDVQLRIRHQRWPDLKVVDARVAGYKATPSRQGRAGRIELSVMPVKPL